MPDITQTCCVSGDKFIVTEKDQDFYKKMGVPFPKLSPDERMRRRLIFRNERSFYKRHCDKCKKEIIAIYPSEISFPVYCPSCWWSDSWDALKYGRDFDFSPSFFKQYFELQQKVPRISMVLVNVENSPYCNFTGDLKNCYLCFGSIFAEDCFYGSPYYSKDSVDILVSRDLELAYECVDCSGIYRSIFCQNSKNCSDSYFLKDCIGCSHCVGCVNLRNKSYCYFNEQLTKEEWEDKRQNLRLDRHSSIETLKEKFKSFLNKFPHKNLNMTHSENSSGDHLVECRNTHNSFFSKRLENCKHLTQTIDMVNSYDANYMENSEWVLDSFGAYKNYNLRFGNTVYESTDCDYCDFCVNNVKNCFGCISLKRKQYCILNKQYSKEEYNELVPRIIDHMKSIGEWGEFFPMEMSPFSYNESVAFEYYPLTKDEVLKRNLRWKNDEEKQLFQKQNIPDSIKSVPESICKQVLKCEETGSNYRIIPQEFEFYKKMDLPIPRRCPDQRHNDRLSLRNPRKLWRRPCMKCEKEIQSTYAPSRLDTVYCENCYNKEVY
jgi:hypothetical protein